MPIQWYPGHMAKARRAIAKSVPLQDVIIEVLDARMPAASQSPVLTELRKQKPCIKVMTKSDLADPEVTRAWLRYFEAEGSKASGLGAGPVVAIASSTDRLSEIRTKIPELCKRLALHPRGPCKTVRAIVVGIPNVGKSTLINALMGRKVAKVADEPAVTKAPQLVTLENGMTLSDNPGLLWPDIDEGPASLRLALGGAIPDNALDFESVATFGATLLLALYPQLLQRRFKLIGLPSSADELLLEIGRRRGCLRGGGAVDLHKAADVLIHEFRSGALGRISLEAPGESYD